MREATYAEKSWWIRFKVLIESMPPTVEIIVHNSRSITLHERGAYLAFFNANGNTDNVPELEGVDNVWARWVIPNTEDL